MVRSVAKAGSARLRSFSGRALPGSVRAGHAARVHERHQRPGLLVVGAGIRGLGAALRARESGVAVRLCEAEARPGGSLATRRSEGFVLELGPFAVARDELDGWLAPLRSRPPLLEAMVRTGFRAEAEGGALREVPLVDQPVAPAGGFEDLAVAYRRELGDALRLGRRVEAIGCEPGPGDGVTFAATLGGEVADRIEAGRLHLAVDLRAAAQLCAPFDPLLPELAGRLVEEPGAFVFVGAQSAHAQAWRGYGIAAADEGEPLVEAIFATNVFARRAQPGKALTRLEVRGPVATEADEALIAAARERLARWTGSDVPPVFARVHRFATIRRDAACVELRARLLGLAGRIPGLAIES